MSREDGGYWKLGGELKNTSTSWMSVKFLVQYLDASGKAIASSGGYSDKDPSEHFYAELGTIPPGATSPFFHLRDVSKISGKVASAKLSVVARVAKEGGQGEAPSPKIDRNGESWQVSGTVKSTGKVNCDNPQAIGVGYAKDGKVASVQDIAPTDASDNFVKSLEPGKTAPYRIVMSGKEIESIKVFVGCNEP